MLLDAVPVISAAAELNPDDPVPGASRSTQARGIQAPREVFDTYLGRGELPRPAPRGCRIQAALQYLCAKWYGSHEEMFAFAEQAADHAPPASKLHALPLQAVVEYLIADEDTPTRSYAERAEAAVTRARPCRTATPPGREAAGSATTCPGHVVDDRYDKAITTFRSIRGARHHLPLDLFARPVPNSWRPAPTPASSSR